MSDQRKTRRQVDPGHSPFTRAIRNLLQNVDANLPREFQDVLECYLVGGCAVHLYTKYRVSADLDAVFSHRLLLSEVPITRYEDTDGKQKALVLDRNYTDVLAIMHHGWKEEAWEWETIGRIRARVISPLDLAVSKVARFAENDVNDITQLAMAGLIQSKSFIERCNEALADYIGSLQFVRLNIRDAAEMIEACNPSSPTGNQP